MKHILFTALLLGTSIACDPLTIKNAVGQERHGEFNRWQSAVNQAILERDPDVLNVMFTETGQRKTVSTFNEAMKYSQQIANRKTARSLMPDRGNLRKRAKYIESELGMGIHQCFDMNEEDLSKLRDLQQKITKLLAHASMVQSAQNDICLASKLGYNRPSQTPSDDINAAAYDLIRDFLPSLHDMKTTLDSIQDNNLGIGPKTSLNSIRQTYIPEFINRLEDYFHSNPIPQEITFPSVNQLLKGMSSTNLDIAHHRGGTTDQPGLTRLESLLGGFSFGSNDPLFVQAPNLFNIIIRFDMPQATRNQLINLRQKLVWISRLITSTQSDILADAAAISAVCENDAAKRQITLTLLEQHRQIQSIQIDFRSVTTNISLWEKHRTYDDLSSLQSVNDFESTEHAYSSLRKQHSQLRDHFTKLKDDFLMKSSALDQLISTLRSLNCRIPLDMSNSVIFSEMLDEILSTRVSGNYTCAMIPSDFTLFFKEANRAQQVEQLVTLKNLQRQLDETNGTSSIISSVVKAQQAHRQFMSVLRSIRSERENLLFKSSNDSCHQKTQFFLDEILRPENHYITLSPTDRGNLYNHTLRALQEPMTWEEASRDKAIDLFYDAEQAYIRASQAIKSISLPVFEGEQTNFLPGFDLTIPNDDNTPQDTPPPPPPPGFGFRPPSYSWNNLRRDISNLSLDQKNQVIQYLENIVTENLSFADATVPSANDIKQHFNLGSN